MIYFDNSATTLQKPESVAKAVYEAIASEKYGNASRSFHDSAQNALREIFTTRQKIAELFHLKDPLFVALTANASTSLNLVLKGLCKPGEHIISSVYEHNSVLRPLYQLEKRGTELSFIKMNQENGRLLYNEIESLIKPNTRTLVINHISNVTGNCADIKRIHALCQKYHLNLVIDASQSAGVKDIDLSEMNQTILCFTGHKSLYGPQGTGGLVVNGDFAFEPVFSGGSGVHSFDHTHPSTMPDIFEVGTMNVPSMSGLSAGVSFVLEKGVAEIDAYLQKLRMQFIKGLRTIPQVKIYGESEALSDGAVIGINIGDISSGEVSQLLFEDFAISTRPGAHCAPKMHESLGTVEQGIVRFSFSSFNTSSEVDHALNSLEGIAKDLS